MLFKSISEKSILRISDIYVPDLEAVECIIMLIIIVKLFNTKINLKLLFEVKIMVQMYLNIIDIKIHDHRLLWFDLIIHTNVL